MPKKLIKFEDHILEELQDPEFVRHYLNSVLEEADLGVFLTALKHVILARKGGVAGFAKQTGLSRTSLYRILSPKGNPSMKNLFLFLKITGYELRVVKLKVTKKAKKKKRKKVVGL